VYNEAAKLVNDTHAAKPARVLNPKQQAAADSIKAWAKDTKQPFSKELIQKELDAQIAHKTINKGDAKAIIRDFFPPEPIRNMAATRYGKRQVEDLAFRMLKTAEDHLISKGVQPTYWNGMRVRLSDVLAEAGTPGLKNASEVMTAFMTKDVNKVTDPVVREAVSKALARRSMAMSDMLSTLSQKAMQVKNDVLNNYNYPTPVANKIMNRMPEQAAEVAKSLGATNAEARSMSMHIQNIIDSNRLPEEKLFDKLGKETAQVLLEGKGTREQIQKGSDIISRMLKETPVEASKDPIGKTSGEAFLMRISTWAGRPEIIKQFSQRAYNFAEVNAADKAKFFRNASKSFSKEQLNRGFNLAQQPDAMRVVSAGLEVDPKVIEAADLFKNYFEWALGSTGFNTLEDLAGVTAVRSSMIMTDLNKHMKAIGSKFTFTDTPKGSFKRAGEIQRDYSRHGVGWMQSWENAMPVEFGQDPLSFMYDVDLAIQRTMAEYATFDEFARRFGARVGDAHFDPNVHKAIIPNPRLAGYKFHPEIQQDMLRLIKDQEKGSWRPSSPMMQHIVQATRIWKSSVTIYRPIHHERNVIGDAFNMWLAGHNDPLDFKRSIRVLATEKTRFSGALKENDLEAVKGLLDSASLDALGLGKQVEAKATDVIINKRGQKITSEMLWASGFRRGIFKKYNVIEDLIGQTSADRLFSTEVGKHSLTSPFAGGAHAKAAALSEHREHFVRMAHYIAAVRKGMVKHKGPLDDNALNKIYDNASQEVQKYHPDGSDLTHFEQKLRIAIPFYAWTRKEIPLLVQALVERPSKIVAYPRVQRTIAGMSGINTGDQGMLDPYPNDQLFPDWIRATGIGPIGDPQSDNPVARYWAKFGAKILGASGPEGYVSINPSNPFNDVTTQLFGFGDPQDSMRATVNSLNPGLQIPMSLAFNQTFSGAPISGGNGEGVTNYLLRQIPQIGEFSRLSGVGRKDNPLVIDKTKQNLLNFFLATGILGSGPYQKSAEFEAKARAKDAKSKK
jgi:hypothetical protein